MEEPFNSLDILTHLIRLVESAPNLYDSNRKGYRDPSLKRRSWAHIAATMGLTATECKAEWEKLREKYTKQCKRIRAERSGVAASIVDGLRLKWPVFDMLSFLEPHVQARKRKPDSDDCHSSKTQVNSIHCLDNDDIDYTNQNQKSTTETAGVTTTTTITTIGFNPDFAHGAPPGDVLPKENHSATPKKCKHGGTHFQTCVASGCTLNQQLQADQDDSFHFAMSLIPTLRSLDEQQRCTAKLKIMEILRDVKFEKPKS